MGRVSHVDPSDYVEVVGRTFANHEHAPVFALGKHVWTRYSLGQLGVPHAGAAIKLQRICKELGITTLAGLARQAPEIGKFKGVGITTYWLVLALLRQDGWAVTEVHTEDVTFATVKARARHALKKTRPRHVRRAGPPSEAMAASL